MTSPISNTSSSYHVSMLEEEALLTEQRLNASNSPLEISATFKTQFSFTDKTYEDNAQTSNLAVGCGLYRKVRGVFPELKLLARDLAIEGISCIVMTGLVSLATQCQDITQKEIASDLMHQFKEDITKGNAEGIQTFINQQLVASAQFWQHMEEFLWPTGVFAFTALAISRTAMAALKLYFLN